MTENHGSKGFITLRTQMSVAALMGVTYALLVPALARWIGSGTLLTVVCVLLFVPVLIVSDALVAGLEGLLAHPPGTSVEVNDLFFNTNQSPMIFLFFFKGFQKVLF